MRSKIVVITGRIHPSETASSYICSGIINLLISEHPIAVCLRRYITFMIIPMLNPDGVFVGNTRTSIMGRDLNQSWHKTSALMYPELDAVKQALNQVIKTSRDEVDVYLDLHSHIALLGACIYGVCKTDVYHMERHALFPKSLSIIADDFYIDNTVYCKDVLRSGSSRSYMQSIFNNKTNCYTLEVSLYGYYDKQTLGHTIIPYTQQKYAQLGECIVISLLDCYRTVGQIPVSDIPSEAMQLLSHTSEGMLSQTDPYKLKHPISKSEMKSIEENIGK